MKIGDLAIDIPSGEIVVIVAENHIWIDHHGLRTCWDFEVISDGTTYYVDKDDLKEITRC